LSGRLDLQARVRLLFFKKTFRKVIAQWSGTDPITYAFMGALTGAPNETGTLEPNHGEVTPGWFSEVVHYLDPDFIQNNQLTSSPGNGMCEIPNTVPCQPPPK
jgi:hypothetical protein